MKISIDNHIHALLFDLSEDLAHDLIQPLSKLCGHIDEVRHHLPSVAKCAANIIFCGANTEVVTKLRQTKPEASIVVVSRHPEVSGWLDSIEAGATDYCAAPFETAQVQWILQSSMRAAQVPVSA